MKGDRGSVAQQTRLTHSPPAASFVASASGGLWISQAEIVHGFERFFSAKMHRIFANYPA